MNPVRCPALCVSIVGRPKAAEHPCAAPLLPRRQAQTRDFKKNAEQRRQLSASVSLTLAWKVLQHHNPEPTEHSCASGAVSRRAAGQQLRSARAAPAAAPAAAAAFMNEVFFGFFFCE